MQSKTVAALHQEGNQLFDSGLLAEAARAFRGAVERFLSDRRSDKAAVDEFVKVAGNLCVCHHAMGDWNACVSVARELLAVYPIIPKAYAAIGMCIVSRLLQQEAEQRADDLQNSPNMPPRSGEEVRRDARRYLVKLGGVLCTPDDAHMYLCRAILLSHAQLQVSLGPYLETAVRLVSEELLSAGLSLEREYGDGVLGQLSALEASLCDAPLLLDTAPVLCERKSVRVLDAAAAAGAAEGGDGPACQRVEELPASEAEAILRAIREGQEQAGGEAEGDADKTPGSTKPPHEPLDFFLSRQRIPVHVCHAERGGIPRGLTLVRSSGPFAVAQHVRLPVPADPQALSVTDADHGGAVVNGPSPVASLLPGGHPATAAPALDALAHGMVSVGDMSSTSEAPLLLMCNACGKEVNPLTMTGPPPTGCARCNGVAYCSAACATAYRPRHERYECALRVALQARVEALSDAAAAERSSSLKEQQEDSSPAGEVVPGAGWDALDLHRRVLPLCITLYSGLQSGAPGSAAVRARVELGVQRRLVHCLPADVVDTFTQWTGSGFVDALTSTTEAAAADATEPDVGNGRTTVTGHARKGGRRTKAGANCSRASGAATTSSSSTSPLSTMDLLHCIFFMARLLCEEHSESRSSAFYAERLLLRHSCEPNCVWSDSLHSILTSRYICKGEELTVAVSDHFPQHWPWQIRQKWFVHHHGVPCQCGRCLREGADLNDARGALSNALVEQLLTGDILGHPCPTPAHQHPTHLFHRQVQRLVEQSRARLRNTPALLRRIHELRAELVKYVLPSHYLLEDLRRALIHVAEPEGQTATVTSEVQDSLLFWEALWSGAVPAKRLQIRLLPSVFECGRRRRVPPQQRRRRRTPAAAGAGASLSPTRQEAAAREGEGGDGAASTSPSPEAEQRPSSGARTPPPFGTRLSGSDGDDEASKARAAAAAAAARPVTPPPAAQPAPLIATKDFGSGRNIVDLFYGSYQTWYM